MVVIGPRSSGRYVALLGVYIDNTSMSWPRAQGAREPSTLPQPTQLIIVRRGRHSTFRLLEREFGNDPTVRIIWDRRYRDRRDASQAVGSERRHADRRAPAPTVWPETNYFVVNIG